MNSSDVLFHLINKTSIKYTVCYSIWEHLLKIAAENTTIILTTHYVEETRQANTVSIVSDKRNL